MSRARRLVLALGSVALVAATAAPAAATPVGSAVLHHQAPAPRLEEDDPRWRCWVDGDRRCGVEVVDPSTGAVVVVVVQYDRRGRLVSARLR